MFFAVVMDRLTDKARQEPPLIDYDVSRFIEQAGLEENTGNEAMSLGGAE